MTLLTSIFLLAGCGSSPTADHDHPPGTPADHDHPPSEHDHPPGTPANHDHAGAHAPGGGHMADMVATREALRTELGAAYDAPVPGLEGADPTHGRSVYDTACASCHGATGKGDGPAGAGLTPPPADFTDAFHARFYSDAARVHIVRKGIAGTGMAGFEGTLSEKDVLDVYAYVKGLRPAPGTAPAGGEHAHH